MRQATIIDMLPDIAQETTLGVRSYLMQRLDSNNTQLVLNATIKEFTEDGVIYEQDGETKTLAGFDSIILALGAKNITLLRKRKRYSDLSHQIRIALY